MITVVLVLRSQLFEYLRETLYKHTLEHLEAARPEKKGVKFLPMVSKSLTTIDLFEDLRLVGTHFRR